jgi:hypothetical protein
MVEGDVPDFYEHFWPKPELQGLTPDGVADGPDFSTIEPKYKRDKGNKKGFGEHRAALTMKWNTKVCNTISIYIYRSHSQCNCRHTSPSFKYLTSFLISDILYIVIYI